MAAKGINFAKQTSAYREKQKQKKFLQNAVIGLVLILVAGIGYGVTWAYRAQQQADVDRKTKNIKEVKEKRNYADIAQQMDIYTRLDFIGEMGYKRVYWSGFIGELQERMLKSAYLSEINGEGFADIDSLNMDAKEEKMNFVDMVIVVPNLGDGAKQVFSFFESPFIEDVIVTDVTVSDIGIQMEMKLFITDEGLSRAAYESLGNNASDGSSGGKSIIDDISN